MDSFWNQSPAPAHRPPLASHLETDVAVIGAGMAGILIAYELEQHGFRVVILEADRIGSGQTQGTTAKITSQHHIIYKKLGKKANVYAEANQRAVEDFRRLINDRQIPCQFEDCSSYLYSRFDKASLKKEMDAARAAGIPARLTDRTELPFPVVAALEFPGQAHFHPLEFLHYMAKDRDVYEQTPVLRVSINSDSSSLLETPQGSVTTKQVVFACHYPFINFPGFYFLRMHQERSYALALSGAPKLKGNYLCIDAGGWSMRSSKDVLILGGGNHRTGAVLNHKGQREGYGPLTSFAQHYWPEAKEITRWSAQDCMTQDGIPYIGRFSSGRPNWYVATGFGKWGMSHSMVSARLISDLVRGVSHPAEKLYSPSRFSLLPSISELAVNGGYSIRSFSKKLFTFPLKTAASIPNGTGGIVRHKGRKMGVYKDTNGRIYAVSVSCRHLGCQLEWNPNEKTWDCPCHGSRYDIHGNLINNPAQEDLKL